MTRIIKLPHTVAKRAAQLAITKKAFDVCIIDLRKIKNSMSDFFVVCSCDSDTQVRAVAEEVRHGLKESGVQAWHMEGMQVGQWVLIDCVDVVVHVFHRTARAFYNLERLWGDVKIEHIADEDAPKKIPAVRKKTVRKAPAKKS